MRRSYIQPSHHNHQAFHDEHGKEKSTNFIEKRNTATSSHGFEKKRESNVAKKLERMPTEDIDAKADAFIKNFKHHLLIQRLQSIQNHEQILARD
ncbi:hypothetical protein RIF29_28673 [Crotalaria pallida]|uniref:Uncharacterized protein n=1 Tax=Crotalaria pallida TaxID=3830 RepID=A0AAN9HZK9_CROPI